MSSVNVNIRMDSSLKNDFESFCADMGMSMTTAFTIFAKKVVREYRIPFEIGGERPDKETLSASLEVEEIKRNPAIGKSYSSSTEMTEEGLKDTQN